MEQWFVLASVVALFWGSAGIFAKYSTPRIGVYRVALVIALVEGPMYLVAFLVWREEIPITLESGLLAAISCLVGVVGYLCFFESIMDGQVAIAGTISAAYPALTVLGALIFLSESLTAIQSIGVAAIIGGVICLSYEPDPSAKHAMPKRALIFSVLAFFLWGFWSLTSKVAVDDIGAGNLFGFYVLSSVTAPVMYAWFRRVRPGSLKGTDPGRLAMLVAAVGLGINVSGTYIYSFALEQGNASLVVPISSAYPIVTAVLAVALLKEKLGVLHMLALGVVVVGLVMIGVTL
jgi:transporter family protein